MLITAIFVLCVLQATQRTHTFSRMPRNFCSITIGAQRDEVKVAYVTERGKTCVRCGGNIGHRKEHSKTKGRFCTPFSAIHMYGQRAYLYCRKCACALGPVCFPDHIDSAAFNQRFESGPQNYLWKLSEANELEAQLMVKQHRRGNVELKLGKRIFQKIVKESEIGLQPDVYILHRNASYLRDRLGEHLGKYVFKKLVKNALQGFAENLEREMR